MLPLRRTRRGQRNFELGVRGCETDKTGSDPCLFLAFLYQLLFPISVHTVRSTFASSPSGNTRTKIVIFL